MADDRKFPNKKLSLIDRIGMVIGFSFMCLFLVAAAAAIVMNFGDVVRWLIGASIVVGFFVFLEKCKSAAIAFAVLVAVTSGLGLLLGFVSLIIYLFQP